MSETFEQTNTSEALADLEVAVNKNLVSTGAAENIRHWLTEPKYLKYRTEVAQHISDQKWQVLDDAFWTVIPFGTGGRRGRMYPIGSNTINERTIGESAQGLAEYVKQVDAAGPWSCGIAYDTRHRSREFAELCAGVMVANGFKVFFIDDFRSTPELSFLIRYKNCNCGIMVTASHNPPSDNAVKVYWSNGAQLIPPHDKNVIEQVMHAGEFEVADFQTAAVNGQIEFCTADVDAALLKEHKKQSFGGPRDLKVIYSPLHGVGEFNVKSLLTSVGFDNLEIYQPHREPDGDFPNVPDHVSNPENPAVFDDIIEYAKQTGAELILCSDPDCDRMGAAAPLTCDVNAPWSTLTGNQLAALLADYVLSRKQAEGLLKPEQYLVTTLVTTRMADRIAQSYGVKCYNENLVGFKWIAEVIERQGPDGFIFGAEESHGYLTGTYARDKDGAVACLLMAELAAQCKANGITPHGKLDELYVKHGFHAERLATIRMEGSDGMRRMQSLMDQLRADGPKTLGGLPVAEVRDYLHQEKRTANGGVVPLDGPKDNLIIMETGVDGNYVAVRPSGTEPKVKMYMFTFVPPSEITELTAVKQAMDRRLDSFEQDIRAFAETSDTVLGLRRY